MSAQHLCPACELHDLRTEHSRHCIRVRGSPATGRYDVYRGKYHVYRGKYLVEAGLAYAKAKELAQQLREVRP